MVFLHALGERGSDWDVILPSFRPEYRVLVFDLPGHGDSDWPGSYSVAAMAHDLEAALKRLQLSSRSIFVGHSLGGMVAFALAARRPELVDRLVIEDVAPPAKKARRPVPERPVEVLPFDWSAIIELRAEVDDGDPELWDALAEMDVHTLIVAGGSESQIDQERLADAAERMPAATMVTIESGHYVHRERPQEFTGVVLRWLRKGLS